MSEVKDEILQKCDDLKAKLLEIKSFVEDSSSKLSSYSKVSTWTELLEAIPKEVQAIDYENPEVTDFVSNWISEFDSVAEVDGLNTAIKDLSNYMRDHVNPEIYAVLSLRLNSLFDSYNKSTGELFTFSISSTESVTAIDNTDEMSDIGLNEIDGYNYSLVINGDIAEIRLDRPTIAKGVMDYKGIETRFNSKSELIDLLNEAKSSGKYSRYRTSRTSGSLNSYSEPKVSRESYGSILKRLSMGK